jgi:hypothetical protein
LNVSVSSSTSRLDPVSGRRLCALRDPAIAAREVDKRSIGSVSRRASAMLASSPSEVAPMAMKPMLRNACRSTNREASSIDPSA